MANSVPGCPEKRLVIFPNTNERLQRSENLESQNPMLRMNDDLKQRRELVFLDS